MRGMSWSSSMAGEEKAQLRQRILAWRRSLSPREVAERSAQIASAILDWELYRDAFTLLAYLATPREVQTSAIVADALRRGKRVAAPLAKSAELEARLIRDPERDVRLGPLRVPEPDPCTTEAVAPEELDLVLVPGVAFDRSGRRLGRGGGFYDRFLASLPPRVVTCGLAFREQLFAQVPADPWDVRVGYLATEEGIFRCET